MEGSLATMDEQCLFTGRLRGVKAAKKDHKQSKVREATMYAQAEATKIMAAAHMRKNLDQNLLMLMTLPNIEGTTREARKFL